jgi:peptide/nickel transport system substrate-binding protein
MKKWFMVFAVVFSMVILLSPCTPQAASPTASTIKKTATLSAKAKPSTSATDSPTVVQPQTGGIWKIVLKAKSNVFGYPPRIVGAARDYAPPFFDHLLNVGGDGKYQPGLAMSWNTSKDGKTITFKLRQGVTFHDGTPFNAQAAKSNLDNLIPPKANIIPGITSIDVVDDYSIKINLSSYNNLILNYFAANPVTYMYSPEALKKNGADWAATHPVGTGPFMLKDYQPNISLTLVKNPNYWQTGLPYLDGIEMAMVPDPITQMLTLKAGQAHSIYNAQEYAAQLRNEGYPVLMSAGPVYYISFDIKNSEIFSKPQVRLAMEYAIDKEAICNGPGEGLYTPLYQIVTDKSPDYNPVCPPHKYDPSKAIKLLADAGYPTGFSFKIFVNEANRKDIYVAAQSYLDKVGIKMEMNTANVSAFELIKSGKIEKGATAFSSFTPSSNTLFMLDSFWRSDSRTYGYVVKPAGIDKLIDQAKLSRDPATITKINRQILKLIYDDQTIVPLWQNPFIAVVDKSVQNTGWFIYGDADNNLFGTNTWLKK